MTDRQTDLADLRAMLAVIPAFDRGIWLRVGMAVHAETGGSEEGFALWDDWARSCTEKYEVSTQRKTWRAFRSGKGVTRGTLVHVAREHGYGGHVAGALFNGDKPPAAFNGRAATAPCSRQPGRVVARYDYFLSDGQLFGSKTRFDPKAFRWEKAGASRGQPCPPYALPRLLDHADEPVYVVEGEKDADLLNSLGLVAISIEVGHEAQAAQFLAGRICYVVPDNDKAGEKRAQTVLAAITGVVHSATLVRLPGLAEKGDVSDWLDAGHTVSDLVTLTESATLAEDAERLSVFTTFDEVKLSTEDEYLIDQIVPRRGIGVLYGMSGIGKTFLTLDMGLSVTRGVPFAGKFVTEQGAVIYVALEAPVGVKKRLVAYSVTHGANGGPFALLTYPLQLADTTSVDTLIQHLRDYARIKGHTIRLVVIDTLAKAMPKLEENAAKDAAVVWAALQRIQTATDGCVLAVHHPGKDKDRGLRGSSALFAGADFVIKVDGEKGNPIRIVSLEKNRDGEETIVGTYRLDAVDLGVTSRGKAVTSAIVVWVEGMREKRVKMSKQQQGILRHLDEMVAAGKGREETGSDLIPPGTKSVDYDELVQKCIDGHITDAATPRSARAVITKALGKLRERNIVGLHANRVWRANREA